MTSHPVPAEALKTTIAIVGRVGSGKTFTAKGMVELLLAQRARVCIIDPTGVWHGLRSSADGKAAGFPIVVFGGMHGDVPLADTSGAALAGVLAANNLPAIVDVSEFTRSGIVRFATAFLDALYRANRNPLTLVVDEADIFAPQRPEPDSTTMLSRMEQIVRRGRVRGFRPWLISQRPAVLNKNVLSQANTLIAMQLTAPQDRAAIGAWIEGQADIAQGKKILADLPGLGRGEGYVWAPGQNLLARVQFPPIATFDSSRTPEEGDATEALAVADVDLSAIGESLEEAQREAEDNDPKLLRKRIQEHARGIDGADPAALEAEFERGYEAGATAVRADEVAKAARLFAQIRMAVDDAQAEVASAPIVVPVERKPVADATKQVARATKPTKPATNGTGAGDATLSKAERLILTALAQYPLGRTAVQVALLTGYKHSGGGFRNAIGSLRTKGYLIGDSARLQETLPGHLALGAYDRLPTGPALLDHWYRQLTKAERKILESLAEVHPRTLTPAQIANRSGYEAGGGGFRNALGRLRTLELIKGRADIRASEDLFNA